jgi:molybdopterin-binding protein
MFDYHDNARGRRWEMKLSARNQLPGVVASINLGGVMAEVLVKVGDHEIVSVITRRSVEDLGLAEGDEVTVVIKSTEVMLSR